MALMKGQGAHGLGVGHLAACSLYCLLDLITQNLGQITEKPGKPMYWGWVITLGNWKGWGSKEEDQRQLNMPPMHD